MSFLKRVIFIVAALEIAYLAIFNIALNIPLTQDLINRIKPDKFAVNWDSAWTLYPFRVHASGVAANGQARSQQWQVKSPQASASISLLPLIYKTVSLNDVQARDVNYFQRPRPKDGKDYSTVRQYFPPIDGRELEVDPPQLPPRKTGKKGWTIELQDMFASGQHKLWLYQLQASFSGKARADLSVTTRGGSLSLSNGQVDLALDSLQVDGSREVFKTGHIKGTVDLLPFIIKENKGLKALNFLNIDAEINTQTDSLAFLNLYLQAFQGMELDGAGEIQGRLILKRGKLLEQSTLEVSASALSLEMLDYRIEGDGNIHMEVPATTPAADSPEVHFTIAFDGVDAFYANNPSPLLTGNGMVFNGVSTNNVIRLDGERAEAISLAVSISSLKAPDLSAFQRFLPEKWALSLVGGEGELQGQVAVDHSSFSSNIKLYSDAADVGINDLSFSSDLDIGLNVNSPELETGRVDISGTHVTISNTKIAEGQEQSDPWHASINVKQGIISLDLDDANANESGAKQVIQVFMEQDIGALLAAADEELTISGSISDLRWLNILLKNPHGLVINGNGEITSNIVITSGWLDKGTELAITPQQISVEILEYIADGDGSVSLKVIKGGEFPDMQLDVDVHKAEFRNKLETQAFIENIDMSLQAIARGVRLDEPSEDMEISLKIPSAEIKDMSVYNQYLPENSPLYIVGGQARLIVDILLQNEDAQGFVNLDSKDLAAIVDEQEVSGELSAEIKIAGGIPEDMNFDVSGSVIKLDGVKVVGESADFNEEDWATKIRFTKANTIWKKPVQLDVQAKIEMTDSKPLVSMLENQKGKETWLTKALTIDDVEGDLNLQLANKQIVIPYAFVSSDNIDVGAKAIINAENRNGMVYVRYKKLKGLLKINDGKRNIDILHVQKKFDAYSTDEVIAEKGLSE